jgi:hypothetical protein
MTTPRAQPSSLGRANASAAIRSGAAAPEAPFVINLCSSTTPVALSQPQDSELKRFTFFVSRRLEDGRERFRLHMGFFETLQDAEEWLSVVREVYPGAWAGEAPGKRLSPRPEPLARAMQAPAPSAPVSKPAAPSRPQPTAAPLRAPAPAARVAPARSQPATPSSPAARPGAVRTAPVRTAAVPTVRAAPSKMRPAHPEPPTVFPASSAAPAVASAARSASTSRATPSGPAPAARSKAGGSPVVAPRAAGAQLPLSNVREVLRALDETGSTKQMPAGGSKAARAPQPGLSDSQVLKLLETRRFDDGHAPDDSSIAVLKPDDTGTRRELKEAVASNAPVSFAVQLQWSVQPIEIAKVPPLAIFSAYTLYTVEGSREGRRWYGLRLGFFTDALSAKQVAQYVRSEFASVAVVPVSAQERTRASATDKGGKVKSSAPAPILEKLPAAAEFKLLDESPPAPVPAPAAVKQKETAKEPAKQPGKGVAASAQKRSGRTPGRVRAREKRSPQTLEETLEILGADELEIEDGNGQSLSDTGVRHLMVQVRKESPFTKLLDRLSERARKGR